MDQSRPLGADRKHVAKHVQRKPAGPRHAAPKANSASTHVGRIGALAVALGIGAAAAAFMPAAAADSSSNVGSTGSTGSSDSGSDQRGPRSADSADPTSEN